MKTTVKTRSRELECCFEWSATAASIAKESMEQPPTRQLSPPQRRELKMIILKKLFFALCILTFISANAGRSLADAVAPASIDLHQTLPAASVAASSKSALLLQVRPSGSYNPAIQPVSCKKEGTVCTRASQCCSGSCVKGMDEGRPGAWCGADR
jgi:hypothetical protein